MNISKFGTNPEPAVVNTFADTSANVQTVECPVHGRTQLRVRRRFISRAVVGNTTT